MWDLRHLTHLKISTADYKDSVTFLYFYSVKVSAMSHKNGATPFWTSDKNDGIKIKIQSL
jgi:hypothetical protein